MADPDIFVNYRTDDEGSAAALIADGIAAAYGPERVFYDHGSISGGRHYPEQLETAVGRCTVLLAVIGDRWLDARDARGRRRLDDEEDWTRREIISVLQRGAHVIPVLVAPRQQPLQRSELPEALGELAELQFRTFSPRTKESDLEVLFRDLAELVHAPPTLPGSRTEGAAPAPPTYATHNTSHGDHDGHIVQAQDISGSIGPLISNPTGNLHTGSGPQNNTTHNTHIAGDQHNATTHVAGDQHTAGPSHTTNTFSGGVGNYLNGSNSGGMHQTTQHAPAAERAADPEEDGGR